MKMRRNLILLAAIIFPLLLPGAVRAQELQELEASRVSIPVLMYHQIYPAGEEVTSEWGTSYDLFAAQMAWFHENGYHTITTDELYRFVTTGEITFRRSFLPVFDDDWYISVRERVLPTMGKYGFVPTLALYTNGVYEAGSGVFTWSELREWEEAGLVDVQSHSVTHPMNPTLTGLGDEELRHELLGSKEIIEQKLGKNVVGFIAPCGAYDERVLQFARSAGYRVFYLLNENGGTRFNQDPMKIYRVNMVRNLDFATFVKKMEEYSTPTETTVPAPRTSPPEAFVNLLEKKEIAARLLAEVRGLSQEVTLERLRRIRQLLRRWSETCTTEKEEAASPPDTVVSWASVLDDNQIVSFYGHPSTPKLGILGEHSVEELADRLRKMASEYDAINGEKGVTPAFHIIYGTVWPRGEVGILSEEKLMEYINYAEENDFLVILDHQLGKYTVAEAITEMLPYLKYECVHLAIDPEWHTTRPAEELGYVTGEQINTAQVLIQQYLEDNGISGKKILVVHQFNQAMIRGREEVHPFERVDLIHDDDGFGSPSVKRGEYAANAAAENLPLKGIKLFFERPWRDWGYDNPLMTPEEVLALKPTPVLIIYQ